MMSTKLKTILAIDTSCDETSVAIVKGRRVIAHVEYSQITEHVQWGGVVPSIARRAHEERIDWVVEKTLAKAKLELQNIDCIGVTYGPGLAIALEVGIKKAKELAQEMSIPIIPVNHMEGHLYSPFIQNRNGNPKRDFEFPYIGLLVSGGHTELVLFKKHLQYEILGETRDDAAGEALDKAARMLGFGYPGGPVLERLALDVDNEDLFQFPQPMIGSKNFEFSFSGLKTSLLYKTKSMSDEEKNKHLHRLASSFQEAVFQTLMKKTKKAMVQKGVSRLVLGGGVAVNQRLRKTMREMVTKLDGSVFFPSYKYLNFDNAAMIGVVAHIREEHGFGIKDDANIDREPRLSLLQSSI